jgi:hypothetical protein
VISLYCVGDIARAVKDSRYCNTRAIAKGATWLCSGYDLHNLSTSNINISFTLAYEPYRHLHSHKKKISFNPFSNAKHGQQKVYRHFKDNISIIPADLQDMFYLFLTMTTQKHPSLQWKANSSSARQTNIDIYGIQCAIPVFTQVRHLSSS